MTHNESGHSIDQPIGQDHPLKNRVTESNPKTVPITAKDNSPKRFLKIFLNRDIFLENGKTVGDPLQTREKRSGIRRRHHGNIGAIRDR